MMKLMNENSHVVCNNNKNTKYVPVATLNQQLSLHCQLFFFLRAGLFDFLRQKGDTVRA